MNNYICQNPNCGHTGNLIKKSKGNSIVAVLLCLFLLPIGIVYILTNSGHSLICPKCKMPNKFR